VIAVPIHTSHKAKPVWFAAVVIAIMMKKTRVGQMLQDWGRFNVILFLSKGNVSLYRYHLVAQLDTSEELAVGGTGTRAGGFRKSAPPSNSTWTMFSSFTKGHNKAFRTKVIESDL
jgi:hypothetical protein